MAPSEPLSLNGFMIYSRSESQNKRNKQQKTPRGSLRLTVQRALLLTLVLGQPTFFFPESPFFSHCSSLCLPLLPAPFLLPGKQKFLKTREGQRSPPAWPGATWTASCQESSVSCCPPQGNPNKVTSPPESIFPFKGRLCLEPRTYLCLEGDFTQPFTDTVSIKGAHPSPFATALRGRPGLDPNKLQSHLACDKPFLCSFFPSSTSMSHPRLPCYGQPGLQSNQILFFQR